MADSAPFSRALKTSAMSFKSSMMTVRVGEAPDQEDFVVHESILVPRTEYFKRAMNGRWLESDTRVIELKDDDPETFSVYLTNLYTAKFPTMSMEREDIDKLAWEQFRAVVGDEYDILFKVYVLAERLGDPKTKQEVVTAIFDLAEHKTPEGDWRVPPPSSIRIVYEGTPDKNPARRLVVDMWRSIPSETIATYVDALPKGFLGDLAVVLARREPRGYNCVAKANGPQEYFGEGKKS